MFPRQYLEKTGDYTVYQEKIKINRRDGQDAHMQAVARVKPGARTGSNCRGDKAGQLPKRADVQKKMTSFYPYLSYQV